MQFLKDCMGSLGWLVVACVLGCSGCGSDDDSDGGVSEVFRVKGTYLTDPAGDTVVLKGVNKMSVFDEDDPNGVSYFPEIAKTHSNSVRIVWQTYYSDGTASHTEQLDMLISNCIAARMIPIVEIHDATCTWGALSGVVDYWLRSDMLAIVKKYEHALLVNIANEAGSDEVTTAMFVAAYKDAITKLRGAGIRPALVIDAPACGKNLDVAVAAAADLLAHDPDHNLLFSVHPYWSKVDIAAHATPTFIRDQLQKAADASVPLILGELCGFGGWPGNNDNTATCGPQGAVDYQTLLAEAARHGIGWLAWEWGPGNGFYEYAPPVLCPAMDMTTDGTYQSIVAIPSGDATRGWVRNVVLDSEYSIAKTAKKTAYVSAGFQ